MLNDLDPGNLERAAERVRTAESGVEVIAIHGSFSELPAKLASRGIKADCFLADLGFASNQVDDPERGLSFKQDGPLDMRLDPTQGVTAADLIRDLPEEELADLIFRYGEERLSRRIAQKLVEARLNGPILTTSRAASIIRSAFPASMARSSRIDPATRTFQALRIAVNGELEHIERLLGSIGKESQRIATRTDGEGWLSSGARVGIIAFHSLEDRPVKQAFVDFASRDLVGRLTKKPITAGDSEAATNPRARSAKLRGIRVAGARDSG